MAQVNVEKKVYEVGILTENANAIPITLGLAKGDILVYRGAGDIVRLQAGSNGQVLTADSNSPLGVKWA